MPGLPAVVLTPQGAVAGAKLAQTRMLGATVLEVRGDFDQALAAAQELAARGTHVLVNSLNPNRREGQKTAVLEIVEELGGAPDAFVLPYGGGGNTSSYAQALRELGVATPIVSVEATRRRETLATAIRIGDPVHAEAVAASGALVIVAADDDELVAAWRALAAEEGLFCEPSSAAGLAAVLRGDVEGERLVVTITGHGLKDPAIADRLAPPPVEVDAGSRRDRRRGASMIVRAPATSANVGPAFDCAAVALDLWNELELTDGDGVAVEGEGAGELAEDASNLAVRAYALLADPAGKRFRFRNRIPLERGLGSSAAAIALGLAAARPRGEPRGSPRGRADAREPRRQPRGGARRAGSRSPGRAASRASPTRSRSRRSRSCPATGRPPRRHDARCPPWSRTPTPRRTLPGPRSSPPERSAATPTSLLRRSTTGCTSRTGRRRLSRTSGPSSRRAPGARRSRDPGRP